MQKDKIKFFYEIITILRTLPDEQHLILIKYDNTSYSVLYNLADDDFPPLNLN